MAERQEFPKKVQRAAKARADGRCEAIFANGQRCPCKLQPGRFQYDHVIADGLHGKPVLENCQVICTECHKAKTAQDKAAIARAVRRQDYQAGIRDPHRRPIRSGNTLPRANPRKTASSPLSKTVNRYE